MNIQNLNTQEFVKLINSLRLENKNKWYTWQGVVNGKTVIIKAYGTWLQIFKVDGLHIPTIMDIKVSEFKTVLADNV